MNSDIDWTPPHSHDPNPAPPTADATLTLFIKDEAIALTPEELRTLPQRVVHDCYIISTGHGTSGPFTFAGVTLAEIISVYANYPVDVIDVISADNYRARLRADDLERAEDRPVILALSVDGRPLRRLEGLVRLIVPQEKDDALKQVKWVREIRLLEK
jgi:DMSO/TMAO reductase YedYZ molybdopterin-dependent catalytic subunit